MRLLLVMSFVLAACSGDAGPEATGQPLPPGDELPIDVHTMIQGRVQQCRNDEDCPGTPCYRYKCAGLLADVDERWQQELTTRRLVERVGDDAELRRRVVLRLNEAAAADRSDVAFRARALLALEALGETASLRRYLTAKDERLQVAAGLGMTRLGDSAGLPIAKAATESDLPALAVEALRALGKSGLAEALPALLRNLNPELDPRAIRAALQALRDLGDPRATRPLVTFLKIAPDHLRRHCVHVLRAVTAQRIGTEAAAWEAWLESATVPDPPRFTLRRFSAAEDLGIPTP